MAVEGELKLEDTTFKVRRCYITFRRHEDTKGRPVTEPTWRIFLLIDMTDLPVITNWMCDPTKVVDGTINLMKSGDGTAITKIEFKKGTCFKTRDFFHSGNYASSLFIGISGKDIEIDSIALNQGWAGY